MFKLAVIAAAASTVTARLPAGGDTTLLAGTCDRTKLADVPDCAAGEMPKRDPITNCPTCQPDPTGGSTCEDATCVKPEPCAAGVLPTREGCCPTCAPVDTCTEENKIACKTKMAEEGFPVCTAEMIKAGVFDKATCCPKCKRDGATITTDGTAKPGAQCTKEQFVECLKNTPVCEVGQKPEFDGLCCRTCARPNRRQPLRRVAQCGKIRECAQDETPERLDSTTGTFQCPSCRPAKPTCESSCTANQKCVRGKDNTPKCVGKLERKFKFVAKREAAKAFISGATAEEVREALLELVQRFCDDPNNQERCSEHLNALVDGLVVRMQNKKDGTKPTEGEVEVVAEVPESTTTRRRLLANDSPADLLGDAVANNGDNDSDFTVADAESAQNSASRLAYPLAAAATAIAAFFTML